MGIKINTLKYTIPKYTLIIIGIIVALASLKIIIWEKFYYADKSTETRAQVEYVGDTPEPEEEEEAEETPPSEEEIVEYTVSADKPRYLSINKLGITNAKILEVGLTSSKRIGSPKNIYDVAWYNGSSKPGAGGTAFIDGHNSGPTQTGVFFYLSRLTIGDIITIERGDGQIFNYKVVESKTLTLDEADAYMPKMLTSPESGRESLSLMTCAGSWDLNRQTGTHRVLVRAVLV